jgi:hypothetical protein
MAYSTRLAEKIRAVLVTVPKLKIEEKEMFRGLTFMVNGKMCISVSGENLMCRFNPAEEEVVANQAGYLPMKMKNRVYKGYCYVEPEGFKTKKQLDYWINLCLAFNSVAKSSKRK